MIPARVLPDDQQIIGPPDGWAFQLLLDVSKDWSGSTFTVDCPEGLAITLDQSHKADDPSPYVLLTVTSDQLVAYGCRVFRWNLAEDVVLARTFATQTVHVQPR